jgi:hypothetical protein
MAIRVTHSVVPNARDANLSVAGVGYVNPNDRTGLASAAAAAGMQPLGGDEYQAGDGSWIRMLADGSVERGRNDFSFQGIPGRSAAAQAVGSTASSTGSDTSRPGVPSSMRGYAIAQIGIVNSGSTGTLSRAGFVQTGSRWVHPDGSWVSFSGGTSVGWRGYSLAELPYSNGGGWR